MGVAAMVLLGTQCLDGMNVLGIESRHLQTKNKDISIKIRVAMAKKLFL